jgi:hypothetical protein
MYENKRIKPAEIVLRKGEGGRRDKDGGDKSKIHCEHIYKYHNLSSCTTIIC